MTKKILMRLGKSPFDAHSAWGTLEHNFIGGNNGNLIFGYAAHKLFSVKNTTVDANHYRIHPSMSDEVNEKYDGFVLPLANAFRPSFASELKRTTQFIEKLKIPFIMLSGGAQLPKDGDTSHLAGIRDDVKRFARAVLDHSPQIGVRGERTADYLKGLGFKDVTVIGCPSMTLNGPGHTVETSPDFHQPLRIAYNIETSADLHPELIESLEARYASTYFPQDRKTLEALLWGTEPYPNRTTRLPLSLRHVQFTSGRAQYFLDAPSWINELSRYDFSVGSRIHGNIAAVLAGTPALVLAHDARTLELAQHHGLPYIETFPGNTELIDIEQLQQSLDFTSFNKKHTENFEIMSRYIHEAGFSHIHEADRAEDRKLYAEGLGAVQYPDPVRGSSSVQDPGPTTSPLRMLRQTNANQAAEIRTLRNQLRSVRRISEKLENQFKAEMADIRSEIDKLEHARRRTLRVPHIRSRFRRS